MGELLVKRICLVITGLGKTDLCLLLEIDGHWIDAVGFLRFTESLVEIPSIERLVALIEFFLINEVGILIVDIVTIASHLDSLLHIIFSSTITTLRGGETGTIDIAIGDVGEFTDETVDEVGILRLIQ